jgi:hypothetical protein
MPVIQKDRGEDVRVGVLFGGLHGLIAFAYVGLRMNFQWETHVLLGLVLVAVTLGSWLFILWASLLKTTRRIPWALYMCGAAGIGVLVAFHVDGISEQNIAIARQTADRMSRPLQGEVRDRAGIDWLQP